MTSLIASSWFGSVSGNKATKARNWSIPVVNHTWLEDCFIQWRNLSVGLEKYVVFPPGLDFSDHLGERGIQREVILETLPDLIAEMSLAPDKETFLEKDLIYRNGGCSSQAAVKRPSSRRVQETEGLMSGPEAEHRADVPARFQPTDDQRVEEDHMQVDRPVASGGSVPNLESSRARPSGRTAEHPSPLRQPSPSPRRTLERPSSSSKRRHRADPGTTEEDAASPTKISAYAKSAATGSPVASPSKSRASTPRPMESVLVPLRGIDKALGRSPQQSAEVRPDKGKRKRGGTRSESIAAEHYPPLSSLTVDTSMDREEGPSRRTSRRSAASKATQRLRDEVMPDVVNFEKELKRGNVRVVNSPNSKDPVLKPSGKGKKRASIQFRSEGGASSSDGEHERKKRRLSGAKVSDRFKELNDDERTDITGTSSQGSADPPSSKRGAKGVQAKKPSSGRDPRHVELMPHSSFRWLTGPQRQARGDLGHASHSGRNRGKGTAGGVYEYGSFVYRFCLDQALAKLGARVGVKPDECTHLVVKTLARTEKLLCAMAVAPAVVTEKWVRNSIAAKKLLRGCLFFFFFRFYVPD
jgi:mediator of DNA damage checkpoint protein 1